MMITHDMAEAWITYTTSGNTFSDFVAECDDPDGSWKKGDSVRVGIQLVGDQPRYYAINISQEREICYSAQDTDMGEGFSKYFSPYRRLRLRPPQKRMAGTLDAPSPEVDKCGYKCDDPNHPWSLLARNPVSVLLMPHFYWASYYNFSPFEERGHYLWLPVRIRGNVFVLPHFLQVMAGDFLADGVRLFNASEGMLFFFNSLHAGASQNHFHYQAVSTHGRQFAVAKYRPQPGGYNLLIDYPIRGVVISADCPIDIVYGFIGRLQNRCIPFNLVMVEKAIYLFPRKADCEKVEEFAHVLGAMEMAGRFILSDQRDFLETDPARIRSALQKMSYNESELKSMLGI